MVNVNRELIKQLLVPHRPNCMRCELMSIWAAVLNMSGAEVKTVDELLACGVEFARIVFDLDGGLCTVVLGVNADGTTELVLPDEELALDLKTWVRSMLICQEWPICPECPDPEPPPVQGEAIWLFAREEPSSLPPQQACLPILSTDDGEQKLGPLIKPPPTVHGGASN